MEVLDLIHSWKKPHTLYGAELANQSTTISELVCKVCDKILNDPFLINCGHCFCYSCIVVLENPERNEKVLLKNCPLKSCHKPLDPSFCIRSEAVEGMINKLQVKCPNDKCLWKGRSVTYKQEHKPQCSGVVSSKNDEFFISQKMGKMSKIFKRQLKQEQKKLKDVEEAQRKKKQKYLQKGKSVFGLVRKLMNDPEGGLSLEQLQKRYLQISNERQNYDDQNINMSKEKSNLVILGKEENSLSRNKVDGRVGQNIRRQPHVKLEKRQNYIIQNDQQQPVQPQESHYQNHQNNYVNAKMNPQLQQPEPQQKQQDPTLIKDVRKFMSFVQEQVDLNRQTLQHQDRLLIRDFPQRGNQNLLMDMSLNSSLQQPFIRTYFSHILRQSDGRIEAGFKPKAVSFLKPYQYEQFMDQQVLKMKSEAREKQKAQDEKRMTRKDRETQKKTK